MKTIGVIGLGSIGLRHASNLMTLGQDVLAYDPHVTLPVGPPWQAKDVMLLVERADAFVIASPTALHKEHIDLVSVAGKPIFVEKPIAHIPSDLGDANVAMVGYNLRFHPSVKAAKNRLLFAGTPRTASFHCAQFNNKPDYLRDGVVLNWSHEIDLALYLLGPAKLEAAAADNTIANLILRHENGCRTTIHLDYIASPERRGFLIDCENSLMGAGLPERTLVIDGQLSAFKGTYDDDYLDEMQAFLARIDGEQTLGATAEEAMNVVEICEQVRPWGAK